MSFIKDNKCSCVFKYKWVDECGRHAFPANIRRFGQEKSRNHITKRCHIKLLFVYRKNFFHAFC